MAKNQPINLGANTCTADPRASIEFECPYCFQRYVGLDEDEDELRCHSDGCAKKFTVEFVQYYTTTGAE